MTTWILVSDEAQARLYAGKLPEEEWSQVTDFKFTKNRQPSRTQQQTAAAECTQPSTTWRRIRSLFDRQAPSEDSEVLRFATELADYFDGTMAARKFDVLVLVAPPRFLGLLQEQLSVQVLMRVKAAVDRDLTQLTPAELRVRLASVIYPSQYGRSRLYDPFD